MNFDGLNDLIRSGQLITGQTVLKITSIDREKKANVKYGVFVCCFGPNILINKGGESLNQLEEIRMDSLNYISYDFEIISPVVFVSLLNSLVGQWHDTEKNGQLLI